LSGTTPLDALATGNVMVTKVELRLEGGALHHPLIAVARDTLLGWAARLKTSRVTNGTYDLQSVAYNTAGKSDVSAPIIVRVQNPAR
jgi:hypothetical protein